MTSSFDILPSNGHVVIDMAQLAQNIRAIQAVAQRPVLASVKANGYGHGYELAARAFLNGGAAYLGVARLNEGLLLREMGIDAPILVIGGLLGEEIAQAVQANLDVFVWRTEHIQELRDMGVAAKNAKVHIKIDTGMGRLGCLPHEAVGVAQALKAIAGVEIAGLATHFASADVLNAPDTEQQIAAFNQTIASLAEIGIHPRGLECAGRGEARADMACAAGGNQNPARWPWR